MTQVKVTYRVVVHDAEEGGLWAEVSGVAGCVAQGETPDELAVNMKEAWQAIFETDEEPQFEFEYNRSAQQAVPFTNRTETWTEAA